MTIAFSRLAFRVVVPGLLASFASTAGAADPAKDFPNKPVRLIAPFTPGAGTDTTARMLAKHMGEQWKQQVVVDNRTGAAGAIGVNIANEATPDGYTICLISASISVNSATNNKLPYDLTKDLQGISQATSLFYVVYINSNVPVKSVKDMLAYAKANPGKLLYSSSGTGGLQHFAGEMFNHLGKVKLTHVPFKGSAAGIIANLGGEVQVGFGTLFGVRPHWNAGRFRVLAMTDSKRSPAIPDIPTVAEAGVPGYEVDQWYGIIGSAKIPAPVINKIRDAIVVALKDPAVVKRLAHDGSTPVGSTPAEFSGHIRKEVDKWRKLAQAANIKLH